MKVRSILLVLAIVQIGLITFGGYLYSLIEIEEQIPANNTNCTSQLQYYTHQKQPFKHYVTASTASDYYHSSSGESLYSGEIGADEGHYYHNAATRGDANASSSDVTTRYVRPSFSNSVFFVVTTVTTIGYGKFSPTSDIGKIFTIIVAFIGVPVNIVILAKIGELLKKMFVSLLKPLSRYIRNKRFYMILQLVIAITVGSVVFVLIPAVMIQILEHWSYVDAIYYIFITLFTIGFGDFVAGSDIEGISDELLLLYRFLLYMWMYFGMAYIALIVNLCLEFLSQNAESLSKEIRSIIEEKISLTIKRHLMKRSKTSNKEGIQIISDELVDSTNNIADGAGVNVRVNYDEEKLTKLAEKRRASRRVSRIPQHHLFNTNHVDHNNNNNNNNNNNHHQQQGDKKHPGERYTYTNEVYFQSPSRRQSLVELKEFDNNIYTVPERDSNNSNSNILLDKDEDIRSLSQSSSISQSPDHSKNDEHNLDVDNDEDEIDDDCFVIDIELLSDRKGAESSSKINTTNSNNKEIKKPGPPSLVPSPSAPVLSKARRSIESITSLDIKNLFKNHYPLAVMAAANGNKYDNDMYGLVVEEGNPNSNDSNKSEKAADDVASIKSKSDSTSKRHDKDRRRTEFEIYFPVPKKNNGDLDLSSNSQLTKI